MQSIRAFVKRHPLMTFFGLAYGFSWSTYVLLGGPVVFPYGPLLAALVVASVTRGKDGLHDLLSRCVRWRVGLTWYAVALVVPVAIALAAVALNLVLGAAVSPAAHLAPWYSFFFLFPLALLDAPLGEETGWRGYALPRFPAARSPLANTLILVVLIAGWHLPLALSELTLAVPYLIAAIASGIVTNWVYYNARESALLAMVYHTAANTMGGAGLNIFQLFSGPDNVRVWWLLAAVNVVVAVVVVLVAGANLGRTRATGTVFPAAPAGAAEPAAVIS
jgi:membrane protease YdiL (CAAX protease family)